MDPHIYIEMATESSLHKQTEAQLRRQKFQVGALEEV